MRQRLLFVSVLFALHLPLLAQIRFRLYGQVTFPLNDMVKRLPN